MHLGITSQVTITSKKGCMHPGITSQQNTNSGYHYTTSKIMLSALRHYISSKLHQNKVILDSFNSQLLLG